MIRIQTFTDITYTYDVIDAHTHFYIRKPKPSERWVKYLQSHRVVDCCLVKVVWRGILAPNQYNACIFTFYLLQSLL